MQKELKEKKSHHERNKQLKYNTQLNNKAEASQKQQLYPRPHSEKGT